MHVSILDPGPRTKIVIKDFLGQLEIFEYGL
jgi:hypothetical protein